MAEEQAPSASHIPTYFEAEVSTSQMTFLLSKSIKALKA